MFPELRDFHLISEIVLADNHLPRQVPRFFPGVHHLVLTFCQLNWVAGISQPSLSFDLCCLATRANSATVAVALALNKVVQAAQQEPTYITFPSLDLNSIHLKVYTDGSFNSLPYGGSQGGQVIFLCDKDNQCSLLSWSSTKLRRVVCSALAAETLSMCDGLDLALFLPQLTGNIFHPTHISDPLRIIGITDSKSLLKALGNSKQVQDKCLRIEISALSQMVEKGEVTINWKPGARQLSDPLTKHRASTKLLCHTLEKGSMPLQ